MDDIKLFAKNKKRIGDTNIGSENIQSRHRDLISHGEMRYNNNGNNKKKRETTHDRRNGTTKSRKN